MKNTTMRLLGATLGASAIVGTSAVAANAHGFGGFDSHDGHDGAFNSAQQRFSHVGGTETGDEERGAWGAHGFGDELGHDHGHHFGHELGHHFGHRWVDEQRSDENTDPSESDSSSPTAGDTQSSDQVASFQAKQAAIVQRLTDADAKLTDLISQASTAAADDPEGQAAQQLSDLQAKQAKLESLIDAVKAASNWQELAAAFQNAGPSAATSGDTATTPPTDSPTEEPGGTDTSGATTDQSAGDTTGTIQAVPGM